MHHCYTHTTTCVLGHALWPRESSPDRIALCFGGLPSVKLLEIYISSYSPHPTKKITQISLSDYGRLLEIDGFNLYHLDLESQMIFLACFSSTVEILHIRSLHVKSLFRVVQIICAFFLVTGSLAVGWDRWITAYINPSISTARAQAEPVLQTWHLFSLQTSNPSAIIFAAIANISSVLCLDFQIWMQEAMLVCTLMLQPIIHVSS